MAENDAKADDRLSKSATRYCGMKPPENHTDSLEIVISFKLFLLTAMKCMKDGSLIGRTFGRIIVIDEVFCKLSLIVESHELSNPRHY